MTCDILTIAEHLAVKLLLSIAAGIRASDLWAEIKLKKQNQKQRIFFIIPTW